MKTSSRALPASPNSRGTRSNPPARRNPLARQAAVNPASPRGGRRLAARGPKGPRACQTKARAGAFGPRPCGGFAGLGPAKRRRPGVAARPSCAPRQLPYCRWMQAGDGGGGRRGVRAGAAAFGGRGRPAGLPPACQTKERARGPWPRVRSFRALRAPPPPPGRWDFAPPPRRGRQGGKPGRSAGLGMADVGPGLSGLLQFCQAVFLWQKEQHPDFLGNKGRIYKLRLWCAGIP